MFTKLRKRVQEEKGFTLIELLVVILIIGILAAIAIPSFLGQRDKANDSRAKADVRTAQTALETYYTDAQNYDNADLAALQAIEPSLSATVSVTASGQTYTVSQTATGTATPFRIQRLANGTISRTCGPVGGTLTKGGCKNGAW